MADRLEIAELSKAKLMVGMKGGEISCVTRDGEVVWSCGLAPGIHDGASFVQYLQPGTGLQVGRDVTAMLENGIRAVSMGYGDGATDSGANPDFRPTRATAQEMRLRKLVQEVEDKAKMLDKRVEATSEQRDMRKKKKREQRREERREERQHERDDAQVSQPDVEPEIPAEIIGD